jgi:hypothetical protein
MKDIISGVAGFIAGMGIGVLSVYIVLNKQRTKKLKSIINDFYDKSAANIVWIKF